MKRRRPPRRAATACSTARLSEISATTPDLVIQFKSRSSRPSSAAQGIGEHRRVGPLVHVEDHPVVAGAEAQEVALLDLDLVRLHDPHQLVVADEFPPRPKCASRSIITPRPCIGCAAMLSIASAARRHARRLDRLAVAVIHRPDDVLAGAIAVVEDDLGLAVAIGVEQLADMGKAVPLRRILQRHLDDVVADHIDELRVLAVERIGHIGHAVALVREKPRRMAARVDHGAAGIVERQAQAKSRPSLTSATPLDLVRGQEVEPAELIVGPQSPQVEPGGRRFQRGLSGITQFSFPAPSVSSRRALGRPQHDVARRKPATA